MWLWNFIGSLIFVPKLRKYLDALPECQLKSGIFACDSDKADLSDTL